MNRPQGHQLITARAEINTRLLLINTELDLACIAQPPATRDKALLSLANTVDNRAPAMSIDPELINLQLDPHSNLDNQALIRHQTCKVLTNHTRVLIFKDHHINKPPHSEVVLHNIPVGLLLKEEALLKEDRHFNRHINIKNHDFSDMN